MNILWSSLCPNCTEIKVLPIVSKRLTVVAFLLLMVVVAVDVAVVVVVWTT